MDSDLTYRIGLAMTPGITSRIVEGMAETGITPEEFLKMETAELSRRIGGWAAERFHTLQRQEALFRAREEEKFIRKHSIRALFVEDEDYPVLLRETPDAPVMIYVLGEADLNSGPLMNLVGSRKATSYGLGFCRTIVSDLAPYFPRMTVVSGMAYGIDGAAHQAALENGVATVAVVAHGLDMVYPAAHRDLARRIVKSGGAIVSEYPSGSRIFRNNFLERNRIIAGLSELTFVVESEVKGGAMSTANQAFSYSRDVMALPGRYTDKMSSGCNMLISRQKAQPFTSVADLMSMMRWVPAGLKRLPEQKSLFPELSGDQAAVFEYIRNQGRPVTIDELHQATHLAMPTLMESLTDLEFEGVITKLPGARYECC